MKTLRRFSLRRTRSMRKEPAIQKGIFIFLLRCQLGGAKYEKDIDCRRDGSGRRSKDLRFALSSRNAAQVGGHFLELHSPAMEQTPTVARAERNLLARAGAE
jgi:hypothetical protein